MRLMHWLFNYKCISCSDYFASNASNALTSDYFATNASNILTISLQMRLMYWLFCYRSVLCTDYFATNVSYLLTSSLQMGLMYWLSRYKCVQRTKYSATSASNVLTSPSAVMNRKITLVKSFKYLDFLLYKFISRGNIRLLRFLKNNERPLSWLDFRWFSGQFLPSWQGAASFLYSFSPWPNVRCNEVISLKISSPLFQFTK